VAGARRVWYAIEGRIPPDDDATIYLDGSFLLLREPLGEEHRPTAKEIGLHRRITAKRRKRSGAAGRSDGDE
jgi:hypothetical protein